MESKIRELKKKIFELEHDVKSAQQAEEDAIYHEWELELSVKGYKDAFALIKKESTESHIISIAEKALKGECDGTT